MVPRDLLEQTEILNAFTAISLPLENAYLDFTVSKGDLFSQPVQHYTA